MNNPLIPGDIAEVSGLQSANAQRYNGSRGIILEESKPDQKGNPRYPIRLFKHRGKVLDVRVENLHLSRDLHEWILPQFDLTRMIGEFCCKLWGCWSELGPAHPHMIDEGLNFRRLVMKAKGHNFFWLALDAVGHHLMGVCIRHMSHSTILDTLLLNGALEI